MCVGVKGVSVPGASTARPSACADQPSRRSTACRGTRRGRPRRRWRARRPPRAAHRCLLYGVSERRPPGSYHPAAAVQSRRLATRSPCDAEPTSRRHNGDASHIHGRHGHASVRSPSRHPVSCQRSPCVGCCASTTAQTRWRRVEVVEVRKRQSRTSRQAWLAAAVEACAFCRRLPPPGARGASAQVCRGGERADYSICPCVGLLV